MPRRNRRSELASIALKLFAQKGYNAATLHDIAKEVGMTEAAVYRHFTNKEDMALSFFNEYLEIMDRVMQIVEGQTTFERQLTTLIEELIYLVREKEDLFTFCVLRNAEFINRIRQIEDPRHPLGRLKKIIEKGQQQGVVRKANSALITGDIFMSIANLIFIKEQGYNIDFNDPSLHEYLYQSIQRITLPDKNLF